MTLRLRFETHATTEDNEAGIATGWLPGRLSASGRLQSLELGKRNRSGIDAIFVSDLARAVETVTLAFPDRTGDIIRDARLRECDYGDWNGSLASNLTRRDHLHHPYPNGESWRQATTRVQRWLHEVRAGRDGACLLVVGHTATKWALDEALNGTPLEASLDEPFHWQPGWTYTV